jgi:hypothetical protein
MLADRTGDARLAQAPCTVLYVCVYVCNLAMSSDVLLLLLFSTLGGKSRIDRSIFLNTILFS